MRIGIDAKWLYRGPPSGRRVVHNLVESLLRIAPEAELHFFVDRRGPEAAFSSNIPRERLHAVWASNNQLSNLFVVSGMADQLELDAVVYQNFVPLPQTRHARIAFVHDVIFDSHPEFFTFVERLYFSTLRLLTPTADRVCTVSQSERRRLVDLGYARNAHVDVVPNGVDRSFAPRECLPVGLVERVHANLELKRPFVLYVGRLTARKNVAQLVRAIARTRTPDLELVIVGRSDGTSTDLTGLVDELGIANRVRFLGPMDIGSEVLRVLFASAAVFCFPSLEESFGLPPLEAMASGTPAVVSSVAAIVETCGDAAVYVDGTDPSSIAAGIDEILADSDRREALRTAGLLRARQFTWDDSARSLLETVRRAVESRGAS